MRLASISAKRRSIRFQQAMAILLVLWSIICCTSVVMVERKLAMFNTIAGVSK